MSETAQLLERLRELAGDGRFTVVLVDAQAPVPAAPPTPRWLGMSDAAAAMGVSLCTLSRMVQRAPPNLPGAPVIVGRGKKNRTRRWNASELETWLRAYREWEMGGGAVVKPPVPGRSRQVPGAPKRRRPSLLAQVAAN